MERRDGGESAASYRGCVSSERSERRLAAVERSEWGLGVFTLRGLTHPLGCSPQMALTILPVTGSAQIVIG